MKSVSFLSVKGFLDNVKFILSLSAPGAAKLVNPFALSNNELSSFAFTNVSSIFKPIRYEGVFV